MTDVVSTSVRRKKWREYWKVKASHIQEGALFSLVSVWQISQEDFKDIIIQEPKRPSLFLVTWKKFYVHLAGCTGGAHLHIVDLLKQLNQSEVFSPEESDDIVVFCPVRSHIRTDISVALETVPALKPTILVVLHHTFDPNSVEADSKRQVCNRLPDLLLTLDCLFNEGKLLSSKHNKVAYMEIIKLIATSYQGYANKIRMKTEIDEALEGLPVSGTKFFVCVASETKNTHMEWVSKMKRVGHTEVNIQEDADYYLVFCPVKSRIKTDIDEALEGLPDNKAVILVVMHHTFDPDLVIVESRLQELPRNVRLTVDSLFYQGRLLGCNRNDIAWNQIQKTFNIPIPEVNTKC
ncbi:hypothetical protein D4764_19G0003120 [Takifugu flavidus]|uniref:Uncharacterized protein n=1 Tax=Takifugu flavidus TaxID=433684 RepID=A0A5C6NMA0_9TELE|nr:hypothetical protein D4764_19G0003120 [Takifugu flavidus]